MSRAVCSQLRSPIGRRSSTARGTWVQKRTSPRSSLRAKKVGERRRFSVDRGTQVLDTVLTRRTRSVIASLSDRLSSGLEVSD
ncbi:hypothetical protein IscW_ISCW009340 [Ixodes scapularis]|uniref:Uncharacterized protein n=1 Tax=Ixodes scapularis TaxID=6945 RepID=B7Q0T8_IXOSC|nr:hypothetical protein IscW_ISCW009340 [Ixodes scapularis]|eukprot:XP_002408304.1 hypothetical protein IscW_ISCW009340 [Ixodes scapularis]